MYFYMCEDGHAGCYCLMPLVSSVCNLQWCLLADSEWIHLGSGYQEQQADTNVANQVRLCCAKALLGQNVLSSS